VWISCGNILRLKCFYSFVNVIVPEFYIRRNNGDPGQKGRTFQGLGKQAD